MLSKEKADGAHREPVQVHIWINDTMLEKFRVTEKSRPHPLALIAVRSGSSSSFPINEYNAPRIRHKNISTGHVPMNEVDSR